MTYNQRGISVEQFERLTLEETDMSWKTYVVTAASLCVYIAVMTLIVGSFFLA